MLFAPLLKTSGISFLGILSPICLALDISLNKNHVLIILLVCTQFLYGKQIYCEDNTSSISLDYRLPNSHLHVYMPSLPYAYIMRLINGTLVRLSDSSKGWEYFIAYKHEKKDDLTYDFWLRKDVKFQDGSHLNADSVVENFAHFQKGAFTYTHIHKKLKKVEKIGEYRIRIHLNAPYGMLFHDLARINLYTPSYYKKHQWSKSITAENTAITGPFGSGPYMLFEGFAKGLSQSDSVVLKANPYYFEEGKPYIQTLTIYTKKPSEEVVQSLANSEGKIDIAPIPLNKKTEIVNSEYAKLVTLPSTTTLSVHMNLMNKKSPLQDKRLRQALNYAINQDNLVTFAYKNEGVVSLFPLSANIDSAKMISKIYKKNPPIQFSQEDLHKILNGLALKVITQDRFMSIWKGIEYQLSQYGVSLIYDVTSNEKYVLNKLLTNRSNRYDWDLLIWGNEDWYGHPFASFFTLYTPNQWCAIEEDSFLDGLIEELFEIEKEDPRFVPQVEKILKHTYQEAYMLSIPSPNMVYGLNKEVDFIPSSVAIMRLWEAKITPYHWSVRQDVSLPKERLQRYYPKKIICNE